MKRSALGMSLILILTGTIFPQEKRPKVAIKTFDNPANYSKSTIGNGLTDILTTELQNTGKFDVLERSNVDELMKEMNFGDTEYANGATFAKKGGLLGAQYLLMGKVTNFSYVEHEGVQQKLNLLGPNREVRVYSQQADVRVDFRLIDISTGETVISQAGEAHKQNISQVSEMSTWFRCTTSGSITSELSSSLIGRTTTEALRDIVRKLNKLSSTVTERGAGIALSSSLDRLGGAKGQILAEEGAGLWIVGGIGSAIGLQKGDHLLAMRENLIKDKAGKVIYKKQAQVGLMEVTDVSEADHAEARFLTDPTAAGSGPRVNDVISVDVNYAKSLRGGNTPANPTAVSSASGTSGARPGQVDELVKRADGYVGDKFWSQALDEYTKAAGINPADPRVLQGQALSHYMMEDFIEGDESADKLLRSGFALSVPFAHYHAMGTCTGQLVIQHGKLTYKGGKDDGFEVSPADLTGVEVRTLPRPMMANEQAPKWPVLEIRIKDEKGKDKKYEMLAYAFSKRQKSGGKNFVSAFPMEDSDIADVEKFENSMVNLIQKFVR